MTPRLITGCVILVISQTEAFIVLMGAIPNGNNVPHPCRSGIWPGVGHLVPAGGGLQNKFGTDFELNGLQWSAKFCRADSDGDGRSNGQELGDPTCSWRVGRRPRLPASGHPGQTSRDSKDKTVREKSIVHLTPKLQIHNQPISFMVLSANRGLQSKSPLANDSLFEE